MESLSSGTYGGVGKPGPRCVDLYLDIVEVPQALLGDEAPDDGLEDPGIAAYREVVLLAGPGVRQEDMPVAEFLVIELVLLELDPLERAGDSLERGRLQKRINAELGESDGNVILMIFYFYILLCSFGIYC